MAESQNPLFAGREPADAAKQLAIVLAWSTECHLATLDRMEHLKSTSKYAIERQREICNTAAAHCKELGVAPVGLRGRACPRLAMRLLS